MQRLRTVKAAGGEAAWSAARLRAWFADPQIFGARRLLSDASGAVEVTMKGAVLSIRVVTGGRTHFATVRMAALTERSRSVTGNCTCGSAGLCEHIVAGLLLHTAGLRQVPVDVVLTEVIGSGTTPDKLSESKPAEEGKKSRLAALTRWVKASPAAPMAEKGGNVEATLYLEGSNRDSFLLDRVGVEVREVTRRSFTTLGEAASNVALPRAVQRGAALLLAEGAARSGETWGSGAASACLEMARTGRLRLFGSDRPLRPGERFEAALEWKIDDGEVVLDARLPAGTTHVVDALPGLYVTDSGEVGELHGVPPRVLHWARQAPAIPLKSLGALHSLLTSEPGAASYLPTPPMPDVERADAGRIAPTITLRGQGSTARVDLSFDYGGGLEVSEPGALEIRKFVNDKWLVARRDTALEKECIARLQKNGVLKQTSFRKWSFHIPALFAHVTRDQWLELQKGLVRDLEFEDWNVRIEEDFGFRPDVVARKDSAEAEQRFNRKRHAA